MNSSVNSTNEICDDNLMVNVNSDSDRYFHDDLKETVDVNVDGDGDNNDNEDIGGDWIVLLTVLMKFAMIT